MCSSEAEACGEAARLDMVRSSGVEVRCGLVRRFTQRVLMASRCVSMQSRRSRSSRSSLKVENMSLVAGERWKTRRRRSKRRRGAINGRLS